MRRPGLLRHTKRRDSQAISHHYDVSNTFYEWVLGPSMSYTCACYPKADVLPRGGAVDQARPRRAQARPAPGHAPARRRLRLGRHGHARREGVRRPALGVTLSRQQAEWAQKAIVERGLADLAEVRHLDYRDVAEDGFDAVSSIGLTEHIGAKELPGLLHLPAHQAAPARPPAQPLHHPPGHGLPREGRASSSTATSSRTGSSRPSARSSPRCRTTASRSATSRTCASTTR